MSMPIGREIWVLWMRWSVATVIGWVLGMVLAIVLSYLVVNPFYPRETNLIVGICLGAAVAMSQKLAVRRWIGLAPMFVWGAAIGIGIPFVATVILDELGTTPGASVSTGLMLFGAALCGLLQLPALRPYTTRARWWPIATTVVFSAAWLMSRYFGELGTLGAAVFHGLAGGAVLVWMLRPQGRPAFG